MRVVRALVTRYRLPFVAPYVTAAGVATHREGFILEVETDSGVTGLGEASLLPHDTEGIDTLARSLHDAATDVVRESERKGAVDFLRIPTAGLTFACADARARELGFPMAALIDVGHKRAVEVNALIGGGDAETVTRSASVAREEGYRTVKLKVGVADSPEAEAARVAAAREALGPEIKLRLDANCAWSESQALVTLRLLAPYDIEYIEQPVQRGDLEAMRRVREATGVPTAADEDVEWITSAREVIQSEAVAVVVLKPVQLGATFAAELAGLALDAEIGVVVTTSIDTGIGTATVLHVASALGGPYAHGLSTLALLEDDLVLEPALPIIGGRMALPAAPGIGVQLDEAALARYAVDRWEYSA